MSYTEFRNRDVEQVFNSWPKQIKDRQLFIRELIFQIADEFNEIGSIEETLKWEAPSYLTKNPKTGTTIRLGKIRFSETAYAVSVHCQTSLIAEFKELFPELNFDKNRSVLFDVNDPLPIEAIKHFIYLALTYHSQKK